MSDGEESFPWHHAGVDFSLGVTRRGSGPLMLMLPAPSSISTRAEWHGLQCELSSAFATVAVDLPGFGTASKPQIPWTAQSQHRFVHDVIAAFAPAVTVAAGHSAIHALAVAADDPHAVGRLAMIAPTWRGPLPTMLGKRPSWLARVAALADVPLVGHALYRLNVNRPMIRIMAREHVYGDREWLDGERLREKLAVTQARGARHASVRFVTGLLDPADDRATVLADASRLARPALLVFGSDTPRKSRAEMEALAAMPTIDAVAIADARLAVHEEKPAAVAAAIRTFLAGSLLESGVSRPGPLGGI